MLMKVRVSSDLMFEIEISGTKEAFMELSRLQECFSNNKCGKCGCEDIRYQVRTVEGNDYLECICTKCFAKLEFTSTKESKGSEIFAVKYYRKDGKPVVDENGKKKWLPDGGWVKWSKEKNEYI
jgi:hypothetical protein